MNQPENFDQNSSSSSSSNETLPRPSLLRTLNGHAITRRSCPSNCSSSHRSSFRRRNSQQQQRMSQRRRQQNEEELNIISSNIVQNDNNNNTQQPNIDQNVQQSSPSDAARRQLELEVEETHRLNDRLRTSVDRLDALVTRMEQQFAEAFQHRVLLDHHQQQIQAGHGQLQEHASLLVDVDARLGAVELRLSDHADLMRLRFHESSHPVAATTPIPSIIDQIAQLRNLHEERL